MIGAFATYSVEKREEEFVLPGGEVLPQTARVSFRKENGDLLSTLDLGVVEVKRLYEQIADGQAVRLDQCYIENFSLQALRKEQKLKPPQSLEVNGFVATNSVFDSEGDIDFSFVRFSSGELDLNHSFFLQGGIRFDHSDFGDGFFRFDNTIFYLGGAHFASAHFGKGVLSFKNAKFLDGAKAAKPENRKRRNPGKSQKTILNFEGATFDHGEINFTRSSLGSGDISFSNVDLNNRDLLFVNADFAAVRLNFKSMNCQNVKLDFHFADFQRGDLIFDRAVFRKGIINFSATEFQGGKISFNRTEFEKNELIFESSEFENGKIIFKNTICSSGSIDFNSVQYRSTDILFDGIDFGKFTASFVKARVNKLSFTSCHLNAYFNLHLQECNSLDLSNTVVRDIVDMKPYDFTPNIQLLNLSGLLLLGHFYIDWDTNNVKDLILNQDTSHRNKSEQFRILKENYHSLGQYDAEDEAYVQFRRAEAKADLKADMNQGNFLRKVNGAIVHAFKWLIFDKIGLYATSPVRVLKSMAFSYLFFVFLFYFLPYFVEGGIQPSIDHADDLTQLEIAFYHSIITFLTIGYGDYYPSGVFRWISGFEGFMGLFLISYFTVAFVRKVLR